MTNGVTIEVIAGRLQVVLGVVVALQDPQTCQALPRGEEDAVGDKRSAEDSIANYTNCRAHSSSPRRAREDEPEAFLAAVSSWPPSQSSQSSRARTSRPRA